MHLKRGSVAALSAALVLTATGALACEPDGNITKRVDNADGSAIVWIKPAVDSSKSEQVRVTLAPGKGPACDTGAIYPDCLRGK